MFRKLCTALLAAIILCAGCQGGYEKGRPSDTVTIAVSAEPKRLNPLFLTDMISYSISGLIFRGLTKFDKDMNIVPDLAESWRILPGGREIRFRLKKGILWHDGVELTADDVVFTFRSATSPWTATHHSGHFGPVKEVRATDTYSVSVLYSEPYGSALDSWTFGIIPKHIFLNRDVRDISFDRAPVGTGPYRLKQWVSGEKLWLESFDRFYGGRPGIKNVFIRVIPDASTQLLELKAGGVDVMELTPSQYALETQSGTLATHFLEHRARSFRLGFLGFNMLDERFQDVRVRRAISHAIDKKAIIDVVLMGLGSKSTGPYPPEAWYASALARDFEYNPTKAEELLQDAGWKKGTDGIYRKGDHAMSFTILTNYENRDNIKTAQIIQSNLKAVGIRTDVRTLEWQTFRHEVVAKHQFEAIVLSRAYLWDPDIYDLWHSSMTKEGQWNIMSYRNPALDALLEKGRRTVDGAERGEVYAKVHELLAEDQPCVFLYNADLIFVTHWRIKGIVPSPAGMLHDLAEWRILQ